MKSLQPLIVMQRCENRNVYIITTFYSGEKIDDFRREKIVTRLHLSRWRLFVYFSIFSTTMILLYPQKESGIMYEVSLNPTGIQILWNNY